MLPTVKDNFKKVLKLEEDQGYANVLPAVGANKQPQKPRDMPEGQKQGQPKREESSYKRHLREATGP